MWCIVIFSGWKLFRLESAGKFLRCSNLIRNMQDQEVHKTVKIYQAVEAVNNFSWKEIAMELPAVVQKTLVKYLSTAITIQNGLSNMYLLWAISLHAKNANSWVHKLGLERGISLVYHCLFYLDEQKSTPQDKYLAAGVSFICLHEFKLAHFIWISWLRNGILNMCI